MPQNKYYTTRWLELQDTGGPKDTRTGDEVALDVINRLGLKFKGDVANV